MRNAHKTSAQGRDHYQELTDKIIAARERRLGDDHGTRPQAPARLRP
jgi:hypothetical protein